MRKFTLDELIEKDLLEIPQTEVTFNFADVKGLNHLGLRYKGGVYTFTDKVTKEIMYIGVSSDLGLRMDSHKDNRSGCVVQKILENGFDKEEYMARLEVSIFFESRQVYQEIYEKYMIARIDPLFNKEGKQGGRAGGSNKMDLPVAEIIAKYVAGASLRELAKEYKTSTFTIQGRLQQAGVQIRSANSRKVLPMEIVTTMYQSGISIQKIADEYGTTYTTVNKRLKEAGLK